MVELDQFKYTLSTYVPMLKELGASLNLDAKKERIAELSRYMEAPDFWDDPERSQKMTKELKSLEDTVKSYTTLSTQYDDISELIEMGYEENDPEVIPVIQESLDEFTTNLEALRLSTLLNGEYDKNNAIIRLNAGAGGTEACDWSGMLYRMYTRYADRNGFSVEVLDMLDGDEAGIKSVTFQVNGENAYGYLKSEKGVHRLVRISPFNAAGKRQTSFVSCDVMPEIEEDLDVEINDDADNTAQLVVKVDDESTEASTITISGLELYLDRTLPVGGYALKNVKADNILWENSTSVKVDDKDKDDKLAYDYVPEKYEAEGNHTDVNGNGLFKYSAVTVNDSYVEVVTAGRDQDDSSTTRKIVITIGSTTMAVGTETITLDAPAYINSDNYTMLPLRAVSEAFGATVGWDDASRTVTLMMGQRIVSMTIGSKTMYINGTPVAMNTAPEIVSERTFLPVRDLCNALGITKIDWNEASATVTLN